MRLPFQLEFRGCFMKNQSAARSSSPYSQCWMCRVWSWDACNSFDGATLCLPCYVDVLEMSQEKQAARGVMGEQSEGSRGWDIAEQEDDPGNSPSPFRQLDLFIAEAPRRRVASHPAYPARQLDYPLPT